jgi:hypothetical protein
MGIKENQEEFLRIGRRKSVRRDRRGIVVLVAIVVALAIVAVAAAVVTRPSVLEPVDARISVTTQTIDSVGDVGQYSSLNLHLSEAPQIVYYDVTNLQLKIASWNGTGWEVFAPLTTTPLGGDDVGKYCSAAVNSTDETFVSAFDATTSSLIFASSVGGVYTDVLDSSSNAGNYSSIAVNNYTNTIVISYYDQPNANLRIAVNDSGNSAWQISNADTGGDVGQYSDIVTGYANDSYSILYYDVTNSALKQAVKWGASASTTRTLDSSGDVGKWPSQALRGADWYAAYYDQTNGNLKFMDHVGNVGSAPVVADGTGDVGQYTSIGVNSTGVPFISYYDVTNGDLKLAWNNSGWKSVTLDSAGDVGKFTSLKIDSNDVVYISYYDATNGNLKLVSILPSDLITLIPEFGTLAIPVIGIVGAVMIVLVQGRKGETGDQ